MAEGDYSSSTAILIALNPNAQGKDIKSMGIGLIVHWHKALIGQICTIPHFIKYAHSLMEAEGQSTEPEHRMYCMMPIQNQNWRFLAKTNSGAPIGHLTWWSAAL